MKKFLAGLMLAAFALMFPMTTTHASIQTVDCSWWGKMIHGEYDKGKEGERRRLEQQRRRQEQERQRLEQERRKLEQQRRQQQRGY